MSKRISARAVITIFSLLFILHSSVRSEKIEQVQMSIFTNGYIHWTEGTIIAEGIGKTPKKGSAGQKKALARRAALVAAYRNLLWIVSQLKVKGKHLAAQVKQNKKLRIKLEGYVQGAVVVREHYKNGLYTIRLKVPLNGVKGAASLILPPPYYFSKPQKIGAFVHFKRKKV